jgi:hypothetical protein
MGENDSNQIDETEPGSGGPDGADGVAEQLDSAETLIDRGLVDQLDEGYTLPDREPSVHVPTEDEERRGLSLDELLSAETPEVRAEDDEPHLFDEVGREVGDTRAGRLVDSDLGDIDDTEKELWAGDYGIDGAGASAEEAAVHVIDDGRY